MNKCRLWLGQAFRLRACARGHARPSSPLAFVQTLLKHKGGLRFSSTYLKPERQGYSFPERLLLYHAGMLPTVWVGCTKITALLVFGFSCTVLAPRYLALDQRWMTPLIMVGGAVPLLVVLWATRPYVASLFIRLPAQARGNRDSLLRWSKTMKPSTPVDITTVGILGLPKTSTVRLGSLLTCREKGTIANMQRIVDPEEKAAMEASWRINMVQTRYCLMENKRNVLEPGVWACFKDQIEQNARKLAL